ncbi:MAG: hypothetical protein RID07_15085, partial [Lacipirellulaceae bacterium]
MSWIFDWSVYPNRIAKRKRGRIRVGLAPSLTLRVTIARLRSDRAYQSSGLASRVLRRRAFASDRQWP